MSHEWICLFPRSVPSIRIFMSCPAKYFGQPVRRNHGVRSTFSLLPTHVSLFFQLLVPQSGTLQASLNDVVAGKSWEWWQILIDWEILAILAGREEALAELDPHVTERKLDLTVNRLFSPDLPLTLDLSMLPATVLLMHRRLRPTYVVTQIAFRSVLHVQTRHWTVLSP